MAGFMASMYARNANHSHLSAMAVERGSAGVVGAKKCLRSAVCCWKRPPRLSPADLRRLAGAAKMSESEFFLAMCVVDDPGDTLAPVLRRQHQAGIAGTYVPDDETYSLETPCVYLDDEKRACVVHENKPEECVGSGCWKEGAGTTEAWPKAALEKLGWGGKEF